MLGLKLEEMEYMVQAWLQPVSMKKSRKKKYGDERKLGDPNARVTEVFLLVSQRKGGGTREFDRRWCQVFLRRGSLNSIGPCCEVLGRKNHEWRSNYHHFVKRTENPKFPKHTQNPNTQGKPKTREHAPNPPRPKILTCLEPSVFSQVMG